MIVIGTGNCRVVLTNPPEPPKEPPMQETIKALGMTFTPVENVVKGRRLNELPLMVRVGTDRSNGSNHAGLHVTTGGHHAILLDSGYTDQSWNSTHSWYLDSDLIDGRPRSIPQTKTVGDLKPGEVFEWNGTTLWARMHNGQLNLIALTAASHGGGIARDNRVPVTVIGTITWSKP